MELANALLRLCERYDLDGDGDLEQLHTALKAFTGNDDTR
jgi:hypothetical protein